MTPIERLIEAAQEMDDYRARRRGTDQLCEVPRSARDKALEALAAYRASQPTPEAVRETGLRINRILSSAILIPEELDALAVAVLRGEV